MTCDERLRPSSLRVAIIRPLQASTRQMAHLNDSVQRFVENQFRPRVTASFLVSDGNPTLSEVSKIIKLALL